MEDKIQVIEIKQRSYFVSDINQSTSSNHAEYHGLDTSKRKEQGFSDISVLFLVKGRRNLGYKTSNKDLIHTHLVADILCTDDV